MPKTRVFDLYGTLIDLTSPMASFEAALCPGPAQQVADGWRAKQLEFAWVASLTGDYEPFWALTKRALNTTLAKLGLDSDDTLRAALLEIYSQARAYSEVNSVLRELKDSGDRLVVLSNGDPAMLLDSLMSSGISSLFDQVISVDPVKQFKPAPAAYAHAEDVLEQSGADIWFYSSNPWDVYGATRFGWRTSWVNRSASAFEFPHPPTEGPIADLSHLGRMTPGNHGALNSTRSSKENAK